MFLPGPMELLIIAAILLVVVGVVAIVVVMVLFLVKGFKSPAKDDLGSEEPDPKSDQHR